VDSCHCDIRISEATSDVTAFQKNLLTYNPEDSMKKKRLSIGESIRCYPWDLVTK